MKPPLIVLIELIAGLISRASESLSFVFIKLIEFFVSLRFLTGFPGILIALIIGGIAILLALRFFFKVSKSLFVLWLILIFLIAILILSIL